MKVCAYCETAGVMTKEHVWAASLIRKYEDLLTYNKSGHKFYKGEAVVKDVCGKCNNVVLGALDEYLSDLFDEVFKRFVLPGESVAFDYEYGKLLRVLLKISYNSARSVGNEKAVRHLKKFTKYILEGTHRGSVMLRLQIVTSSRKIDVKGNVLGLVNPEVLRCGEVSYDGPLSDRFMIRMVAINCYWFYIISPFKNEPAHKWRAFMDGLMRGGGMQSGVVVDPDLNRVVIPSSKTTYYHPDLFGGLQDASVQRRKVSPDVL